MKKFLLLAFALFFIISLTACADDNSNPVTDSNDDSTTIPDIDEHVCTYTAREETVNPTCEDPGYTIYFCSCGDSQRGAYKEPLGHSYSTWQIDAEPTVNSAGSLIRECANGHTDTLTLPSLNSEDYFITSIDGSDAPISCDAPSYVLFTYRKPVYDDATLSDKSFSFETLYTSPHTLSEIYVFSSDNHYKKCISCGGFDKSGAEAHDMNDGKCSICNYIPCDVTYSEEHYGLAVSYSANNYELVIPEYYSGSDIAHVGKKIRGIKSFGNNTDLRFITIPASITHIEPFAFEGCTALERVYYEGTWEEWCKIEFGAKSNPMIYASKFYMLNRYNTYFEVSDIILPDTVSVISSSAFEGFDSIASLTIPKSVIAIGSNLNDVFSDGATIGAVYYAADIADWCKISINGRYSNPMQFTSNFYMTSSYGKYYQPSQLAIPENITHIGNYQFIGYTPLTHVSAKSSLTKIGEYAFTRCTSLLSVNLSSGCESIGAYAFSGCGMLSGLDLPKNLIKSGDFAFEGCDRLSTVNYYGDFDTWSGIHFSTAASNPMHVNANRSFGESIVFSRFFEDSNEFYSVEGEVVILSNGIDKIGDYQFFGFDTIAQIIIPDGVTKIGKEAIAYCKNLNAIVIPLSVKSIGKDALRDMASFVEIYYVGCASDWEKIDINASNTDLLSVKRYYYAPNVSAITSEFSWGYRSNGMIGKWIWDSYNEVWYLG